MNSKGLSVGITRDFELCCSCGICKGVCPKSCIEYERKNGTYQPVIDNEKCIKCGICYDVCPGLEHKYKYSDPIKSMAGDCISACNAWSVNSELRHVSASGGCVSTLIIQLLKNNKYDFATAIDTYNYQKQIKSVLIDSESVLSDYSNTNYPKSRYLPVSHEDIIKYIIKHKDARVIFTGTSCAVRGFLNVIEKFNLNRNNYLIIGLFCDKVFNYNIYDYFNTFFDKKDINSLHFKNKDSGGWPGNMKFFLSDGSYEYIDSNERMKMKKYFMPERCFYCIDKLNVCADISIGDNFTEFNSSALGSNSVIIRTELGMDAWKCASEALVQETVDSEYIEKAQYLPGRLNNAYYALFKEKELNNNLNIQLNTGLSLDNTLSNYKKAYRLGINDLNAGKFYIENPLLLEKRIKINSKQPNRIIGLSKRIIKGILKRMHLR